MGISILIVDDDKLLVEKLEETVNWSGIGIDMVFTANNIRQAQKLLEEYPIEMLLCDIDMPQGNGLELLEWIRYKKLDIECTFLSSYANFAYAQMALKLSSREYLLKPISNVDLETALRRIVGIVQEKHQKQKKQEKKGENEKQFWEDLLVQCLQEEYWIERAKKSGYCTPDETFRLILLRVLEIPDKEHYKKEISLYNFVITNVLTEYVETTEMKLETVVHVSDLEWAVVLRNHGSAMGTQEELAELRTCLAGAFPARFCMYMGKPAVLDEISKSRDQLEEMEKAAEMIHSVGAKLIAGCNPIALGLLKTPAEQGADIAVGEGQPLGMPLSFGGPYLGFMAATQAMMRKLPGRIVGETVDVDGKRAFVLTLQAREQHIRREKASSNICSNQALCALAVGVYLATMGNEGVRQAAILSMSKAHYFAEKLEEIGLAVCNQAEFFHEFVTRSEVDSDKILRALEEEGILGGYPLDEHHILWCCTEVNTKEEMDQAVHILREVQGC